MIIQNYSQVNTATEAGNSGEIPSTNKTRKASLLYAAFISAMVYVFALSKGSIGPLVIVQALFILWIIATIIIKKNYRPIVVNNAFILIVLGLIFISNLLLNLNNYEAADRSLQFTVLHVFGIIAFIFAAQWATTHLNPKHIFGYVAWICLPLVIFILTTGLSGDATNRIAPLGVHPNWWGEMAFGIAICILAVEGTLLKIIFTANIYLLMYMVQSRGALLASLVSIIIYWGLQYRPFRRPALRNLIFIAFIILLLAVVISITGLWTSIWKFTDSKLLLLNDPYRGIGTGLTGRLEGWKEAIVIFYSNPVFGQGIDTLSFVHNGFLRWAGEGGMLFIIAMTLLLCVALVRAWRQHNDIAVAALIGIIVYMMTYPRALNLNLVGIIFFLSLFPWSMENKINKEINSRMIKEEMFSFNKYPSGG